MKVITLSEDADSKEIATEGYGLWEIETYCLAPNGEWLCMSAFSIGKEAVEKLAEAQK